MNDSLLEFLKDIPGTWQTRRVKNVPEYVNYLNQLYPSYDLKTQIILFRKGYTQEPRCVVCNSPLKKISAETCSTQCREKLKKQRGEDSISNMQKALCEKYGVNNAAYLNSAQNKRKNTLISKYGYAASPKNVIRLQKNKEQYRVKQQKTLQDRYGVTNAGQIQGHRERVKNTLKNKYGVESISQIPYVKEKKREQFKYNLTTLCDTVTILSVTEAEDTYKDKFVNANPRIQFVCHSCENEEVHPFETYKWRIAKTGTPCSECSNVKKNRSFEEEEIAQLIEQIYKGKVDRNIKNVISPYEIDIFIPEKNIAIEYCGLFWHQEKLLPRKDYHLMKHRMCDEQGVRLITIFQDEWKYKPEIVKNRLIHILNGNKPSISARKCEIYKIETKQARQFCEAHHIQGYASSKIKLGLFYQNNLIGVATFSKGNLTKGQKNSDSLWELSRLCFDSKYSVPGGAGKLVKHFINQYNPHKIISYADKRWNTGNVYSSIGFDYVGDTALNYWYIDGDKRIHRFRLRKQEHEPKDISEAELRRQEGWRRIWDCGHAKYEWINKS